MIVISLFPSKSVIITISIWQQAKQQSNQHKSHKTYLCDIHKTSKNHNNNHEDRSLQTQKDDSFLFIICPDKKNIFCCCRECQRESVTCMHKFSYFLCFLSRFLHSIIFGRDCKWKGDAMPYACMIIFFIFCIFRKEQPKTESNIDHSCPVSFFIYFMHVSDCFDIFFMGFCSIYEKRKLEKV